MVCESLNAIKAQKEYTDTGRVLGTPLHIIDTWSIQSGNLPQKVSIVQLLKFSIVASAVKVEVVN